MNTSNFFILALAVTTSTIMNAQNSESLNLITSIKSENATTVRLNLEEKIETEFWDKDYISVEIKVDDNINEYHISSHLAKEERFKLVTTKKGNQLEVDMPNRRKFVTVNSKPYYDNLTFKLLVPANTKITKNISGEALITMSK
jgi:hypothetical protein